MSHTLRLFAVSVLSIPMVFACSSGDDPSQGGDPDGGPAQDSSNVVQETVDAGHLDASPASSLDAAEDVAKPTFTISPTCNPIATPSSVVTPTCVEETYPKQVGGTVTAGTYTLESVTAHNPSSCASFKGERLEETLEIVTLPDGFLFEFFALYPDRTKAPVGARFDNRVKPTKSGTPLLLFDTAANGCSVGSFVTGFWGYETFVGKDGKSRIAFGADTTRTYVRAP